MIRTVTTLAPSGPGSLAEALSLDTGEACDIHFAVSGNISRINMPDLEMSQPGFRILGETSPEGVNLVGCAIRVKASGITVSGLRIAPGDRGASPSPSNRDCLGVEGESKPIEDVIIRGNSLVYSTDGCLDFWSTRIKRAVVEDNIIAEPLDYSIHPSSPHGTGFLIGLGGEDIMVRRNLLQSIRFRAPGIRGPFTGALVNNLWYNCLDTHWHLYVGDGGGVPGGTILLAIVGNDAILGPDMPWWRAGGHYEPFVPGLSAYPDCRVYYEDNHTSWAPALQSARPQYATSDAFPEETAVSQSLGYQIITGTSPVDFGFAMPRSEVKAHVLANAGPKDSNGNLRSSVLETRLKGEVVNGTTGSLKNAVPRAERQMFGFLEPQSYASAMVG